MGAEFWEEVFPFHNNKEETLRKLQEDVLSKGRHFKLFDSVEDAIEKLGNANWEGLPQDLIESLQHENEETITELKKLTKANSFNEKLKQIQILNDSEGTKSPLDFIGFSKEPEMYKFQYISDERLQSSFGTKEPTLEIIHNNYESLLNICNRLIGVCIPIYKSGDIKELYFGAFSAD